MGNQVLKHVATRALFDQKLSSVSSMIVCDPDIIAAYRAPV